MGGVEVEVVGFVCGVFVVSVVVVGFGFGLANAVAGVSASRLRFGLNLLLRIRRSAVIFCARVVGGGSDGGSVVSGDDGGVGVLGGEGEGGIAGAAHKVLVGVGVRVGVLGGVGEGGIAGSAHSDVGVFSGVGEGGIAGSAHSDLLGVVDACRWSSIASMASAKNLLSPPGSVSSLAVLRLSRPLKMASGSCCCGLKSASELLPSTSLSAVRSPLSSLNRASAASALPWCTSQWRLAAACRSLSLSAVFFFVFLLDSARFGLYPGSKNVGGVVVVVTVVVEVGGVVVVVPAAAGFGLKAAAFAFHFIFTFGGLAGGLVLVPLLLFPFLPLGEIEFAMLSQWAPLSAVACLIRSAIVWCSGASMRRSPLLPISSWTATAWCTKRSSGSRNINPSHRMRRCLTFATRS